MNQKKVWDEIAEDWTKYRITPIKEVVSFSKGRKGKVLDIGCGISRNIVPFVGCKLYGIDFSGKMIKISREICSKKKIKIKLKVANATKIPFEDNFFDYVICIAVLHCIRKKEIAAEEMFRVLKPGGKALVSVWYKKERKESFVPWKKKGKKLMRYYYFFDKNELKQLLEKAGFRVKKIWISGDKEKNIFAEVIKPL